MRIMALFSFLNSFTPFATIFKQTSNTAGGEFLGRLVLGIEDDKVKVFGATIF